MTDIHNLITDNIDVWTSAIKKKSATGRGSSKKIELTGIKKLRELILELAVRGKLVPQDPNDEPASVLLVRIAEEKAQLIKEGVIKKQKPLPDITNEALPFDLPSGWEWGRVGELSKQVTDGVHHTPRYIDKGVPFISVKDIDGSTVSFNDCKYISEEQHLDINTRCNPEFGDVLLCRIGTLGRATIVDTNEPFSLFVSVGLIKFFQSYLTSSYLHRVFHSPLLTNQYQEIKAGGSHTNKLNLGDIPRLWIPIAPLAEQHRIVAKVDELMALCDQLEQQTEQSLSAHQTLVEELLSTLTNDSADLTSSNGNGASDSKNSNSQSATQHNIHDSFNENWQRIAQHFDLLFTTEHSIEQLKQTILQLAVMGKLVPQNPNDEPASVLLEKITQEKAQLIADKKIKKQKPIPAITDEEKPFELPSGWEWTTLSHIGLFSGGKTPSKANSDYWNGDIPWVTPKDMKVEEIFDSEDHVTKLAITDGLAQIDIESLLFVARSGILRRKFPVAITKSVCTVNQDLKVLSLIDKSISNYVLLMMKGFEMYILENLTKIGTTVESLRFDDFSKHYFIMPPLKEQQRIVAKVDELMALCEQLKARLSDAQTTQLHLADAVVETALSKN
ncbi:restriction endonuclease subunit S [uncultured Paraglaciecola sp.]|uniref:restriction endonuclease subunit S n=1 Tax=uncultured Paraglaciecola sp. TaxID=1765024 RepID=UPI00261DA071|nr:restriction endonuclease subunit S [uncultured Paraglaciecola sp.]